MAFLLQSRNACLLPLLFALVGAGCAGYRLGPTNGSVAGSRSVQVSLFENQTPEPRLSEAVASALRKRLQQDGTYSLNTQNEGDIVVTGSLVVYDRSPITFIAKDTLSVRDYDVQLTARIRAVERASGKVVLDTEVKGRTTVRGLTDQSSAERQALPLLAKDLALNITSLLVEGSW